MKVYKIFFMGRRVGAIGVTYQNVQTVRAETSEGAIAELYNEYEHIRILDIIEIEDKSAA